jgi:hypothetical protein
MSEFYTQLLLSVLGNTAVTGTIAYLAKKYVDRLIAHETKRMEAELKIKTDTAIALNAAELQRRNVEHQVRFTKLHERRLEVIANLYRQMAHALRACDDLVSFKIQAQPKDRKALLNKATPVISSFSGYFDDNRIYLPFGLQEKMENLIGRLEQTVFGVAVYHDDLAESIGHAEDDVKLAALVKASHEISELGLTLRRDVESEFRRLLDAN